MDLSFQDLLKRLDHLSDQFRELKEGVYKAADIASRDPEMALTRARKVLEHVIRDVYQRRCHEPAGTRPLENLIQRLVKDGHFPDRLDAYAATVRKLGNVGTHTFGEQITAQDVYQSLTQLMPILEWYFEVERPEVLGRKPEQQQPTDAAPVRSVLSSTAAVAVVPKGLRSFDAQDADFFLDLLPGPRDKNGLPESIRFWKHRVEAADTLTFTVGVIYGPSGCGKSSLVKAGLLPRLADRVLPVYVETTGADTEARLLKGLRKRCPGAPGDLDLTGTMAALRQGQGLGAGQKVFVVLDQFEQWLHAARRGEDAELAQALRQCDGERVQAVVLVRDDFWLAVSRFMGDLHIELLQGQNCALVDLFDPIHARNVLAAFGRAFGRLEQEPTKEQESFLDRAVQGLSQDGRVICVRLALFAEMVKGKPWTPAALKGLGGTEGVGAAFLEGTFSAAAAPAEHRYHQRAARAVLKALLPESGTDIKGHMRSYGELLEASGYANRPKDFDDLIRILDGEIRLVAPTDPEGKDEGGRMKDEPEKPADSSFILPPSSLRYYQLTHDYLVPSLRDWLTRKQKETPRGRAELLLADRAVVWNGRPENRQLPSLSQWLRIRWLTAKKYWTPPQRKMMGKAGWYHGVRGVVLALLLTAGAVSGLYLWNRADDDRAAGLVDRLRDADIGKAHDIIQAIGPYRRWAEQRLRDADADAKAEQNDGRQLRLSLGLLPVDPSQVKYLYDRLLDAEPGEVPVIREALYPHRDELVDKLWAVAEAPEKGKEPQRLRAAGALAKYDPEGERWGKTGALVAHDLVLENPVFLGQWSEAFRPVKDRLLPPLSEIFRDHQPERTAERNVAMNLLLNYAADRPQVLPDLLMDADERQFAVIYPKFKEQGEQGLSLLTGEIDKKLPSDLPFSDEKREKLAKRQANAAVALLKMNRPEKVWPLLKRTPPDDPRVRSYLIHRLSPLGANAGAILKRLDEEPDVTIRRALLLSLGEYGKQDFTPDERKALLSKLQEMYRTATDPGLHASSEWLLRRLEQEAWLKQVNEEWAKDKEQRENRIDGIKQLLAKGKETPPRQWYVNGQGQTMVVVPGPVEFLMGSPTTEAGKYEETQHKKRIARTFALAAKSVTVEQYLQFDKGYELPDKYARSGELPMAGTTWYQAAAYCNWLTKQELPKEQWDDQSCYLPNAKGEYADGMTLARNYLERTGYRLPTEAEMEAATRAGALTSRYFGETDDLLPRYVWYLENSKEQTWPVGSLKPNDWGLFDVQGNVYTWCQECHKDSPGGQGEEADKDQLDGLVVVNTDNRALRGGSFLIQASVVRSAYRSWSRPTDSGNLVGIRPARTFAP